MLRHAVFRRKSPVTTLPEENDKTPSPFYQRTRDDGSAGGLPRKHKSQNRSVLLTQPLIFWISSVALAALAREAAEERKRLMPQDIRRHVARKS
jgi:hypothetical protein